MEEKWKNGENGGKRRGNMRECRREERKEVGNVVMRKDPRWGNKREEEEVENNIVYGRGWKWEEEEKAEMWEDCRLERMKKESR